MNFRALWLGIALVFLMVSAGAFAATAEWMEIDAAVHEQLPRTALEKLEPLLQRGLTDKNYAVATRALVQKIDLEGQLQGGGAEEKIVRLEAECERVPTEMRPILQVVLAEWYWKYFQDNRWTFAQRTPQAGVVSGGDLRTWDLARILREIDHRFSAALREEAVLKKTPIGTYNDLLEAGNAPDFYRPTLYDFVAHEALAFYQAGEQGAVTAEDAFEIPTSSPIFGYAEEFLAWSPESTSGQRGTAEKAIKLYQSLLEFHREDSLAFADVDLQRLDYGNAVAVGEDKANRYGVALERLISRHKDDVGARALARLANLALGQQDLVKAHALAERGWKEFPNSVGGTQCWATMQSIEAKSISVTTESVWSAPLPTINVDYRNETKIFFRAVLADFEPLLQKSRWNMQLSHEDARAYLGQKPALEWAATLPQTADYKERQEKLTAPQTLPAGFYVIIASTQADFSEERNWVSMLPVWVSEIVLVTQEGNRNGGVTGFVVRARDGAPVEGARVQVWSASRDKPKKREVLTTDANGRFIAYANREQLKFVAEKDGQRVASEDYIFAYNRSDTPRAQLRTVFFLDRAIYRPGQTINYKGVVLECSPNKQFEPSAESTMTVIFRDTNGQEIARASQTTNAFGSFAGTFTAPRDRLMGSMSLVVAQGQGTANLRVEEYKRPKFQVSLKAPAQPAQLDQTVSLTGTATAYTGAAIDGARVSWRVERTVNWPVWAWWYFAPSQAKAIAHGTSKTAPDGSFVITFDATPDRSISSDKEPVFRYQIVADVTDSTGETRSTERQVSAGYASVQAEIETDDWLTTDAPIALTIKTHSLDGDPASAEGQLKIFSLKQPEQIVRPDQQNSYYRSWNNSGETQSHDPAADWPTGKLIREESFHTDASGKATTAGTLSVGVYRAELRTTDRFGKTVTARKTLRVIDPDATHLAVKVPDAFLGRAWTVQPGELFTAVWGTGYETGHAFIEIICANRILKSYWTRPDRTQEMIEQKVDEEMRGGFVVRVLSVAENRLYVNERTVEVPWTNKQLQLHWESFRSKLEPGSKENWVLRITGPDAKRASAEVVAALYDASLDQFRPNTWAPGFDVFRRETSWVTTQLQNRQTSFEVFAEWSEPITSAPVWTYRHFPTFLTEAFRSNEQILLSPFEVSTSEDMAGYRATSTLAGTRVRTSGEPRSREASAPAMAMDKVAGNAVAAELSVEEPGSPPQKPVIDLTRISARKNLNETAFFYPQLTTDEHGDVRMAFTMPEALTQWKFLAFAHDRELRSGLLTDTVVTSKDLMVQPNPPRFVREGDIIEFSVKVSNQSDQEQSGTVQLNFADAASLHGVDAELGNHQVQQSFTLTAKQSRSFSWKIAVPDGLDFLTYKAVAAGGKTSDGEEGYLPVLSRRILVLESMPFSVRGPSTKNVVFQKLRDAGSSPTLKNQALTVQVTSQPAWNAILALPYLMEFPYECSEQLFNRYYANALASEIANSDPRIQRVFERWKNTPALRSPLEKNADLKSIALEETPWVFEAQSEAAARQRVGLLFEGNRLAEEGRQALAKLAQRQDAGGLWSWFPGGPTSEYISGYIVAGFGRLRHFRASADVAPALRALAGLDAQMAQRYREIQRRPHPDEYRPGAMDVFYLYGRSFFTKDKPVDAAHQEALKFFLEQSKKYWTDLGSRQNQAQLALALQRFGDQETPVAIMKSLKERSLRDEENGRYWRDSKRSWWAWEDAPVETQAAMIEAFDEVTHDTAAVEDCQIWLLQQKRTQDWGTTKATADAIYALIMRGTSVLGSEVVTIDLGGTRLVPENVEAGTGFYEKKFVRDEIRPSMGVVKVTKSDPGISWGSVSWQYLEDVTKVSAYAQSGLSVKKTLFVKKNSAQGPVLIPVNGPVAVGDELVVRIEVQTDRDLEFVHLKDQRGSGTEPASVLSQYKYQDGVGYYESTRDTATHFFFDSLRRGVYVFEYSTRVQLAGRYQSGLAEVQCMYAPEYNAHSESLLIDAKL